MQARWIPIRRPRLGTIRAIAEIARDDALPRQPWAVCGALGDQVEDPSRRALRDDVALDSQYVARANVHDCQQDAVARGHHDSSTRVRAQL